MFDLSSANGKWRGILQHYGLTDYQLSGKHQPCISCGGRDRWRFDDRDGSGSSICNQCGANNGIGLLMQYLGIDFKEAIKKVENIIGAVDTQVVTTKDKTSLLRSLWIKSMPISEGDEVCKYLANRQVLPTEIPSDLRFLPSADYYDEGKKIASYPAMLALIKDSSGKPKSLHITYLQDGKKAPVEKAKKIISEIGQGSAIRLYSATKVLCLTEGIETALAVRHMTNKPVWSLVSAGNFKGFEPPEGIERVEIWCDNDNNFTGQLAAYTLANKLSLKGVEVDVFVPPNGGCDWADGL